MEKESGYWKDCWLDSSDWIAFCSRRSNSSKSIFVKLSLTLRGWLRGKDLVVDSGFCWTWMGLRLPLIGVKLTGAEFLIREESFKKEEVADFVWRGWTEAILVMEGWEISVFEGGRLNTGKGGIDEEAHVWKEWLDLSLRETEFDMICLGMECCDSAISSYLSRISRSSQVKKSSESSCPVLVFLDVEDMTVLWLDIGVDSERFTCG